MKFSSKVFPGNNDGDSIQTNRILPAFHARYVRVHPQNWNGRICLRIELYGCESTGQDEGILFDNVLLVGLSTMSMTEVQG